MTDVAAIGTVRTAIDGHVLRIEVDNVAKKNAFTPDMMAKLSDALTAFDADDELWVAVLAFAGEHTTAGLDMPKFFGPTRERRDSPAGNIDPFALKRRTVKPVVAAVQGLCLTIGIEMMLAADIVVAADTARFCQMESQARHRAAGRRALPLPHPHRLGQCDVPPDAVRRVRRQRALQIGLVQEVVPPAGRSSARWSSRSASRTSAARRPRHEGSGAVLHQAAEAMAVAAIPTIHARVMGTEDARKASACSSSAAKRASWPLKLGRPCSAMEPT